MIASTSQLLLGDCLEVMKTLPDNSIDSCVTDPPYGLSKEPDIAEVMQHWVNDTAYEHSSKGFMGKSWDSFVPSPDYWREVFRVLKPGGHALVFAGSRTQDLMSIALRFAGFEVRDTLMWVHSQGFPKSLNISKALDKMAGAEREVIGQREDILQKQGADIRRGTRKLVESLNAGASDRNNGFSTISADITAPATAEAKQWEGWGTSLKPAYEPIILVRKPLEGTVAANILKWGIGGLNIDDCRVEYAEKDDPRIGKGYQHKASPEYNPESGKDNSEGISQTLHNPEGRYPSHLLHDGSPEVLELFPESKGQQGDIKGSEPSTPILNVYGDRARIPSIKRSDTKGSAARFFYCAKTSKKDRGEENTHPTVKPTDLMQYLCRLITPPQGTILDPFMGSCSTGKAAKLEGFNFVGIEKEESYYTIAKTRVENV